MSQPINETKALIIVDVQNDYFLNGTMTLENADQASLNAKLLLAHFRAKNLPVIHVQHIATNPDATFFLPNTAGAEIHDNVLPHNNEKRIVKNFPNSFRETSLLEYLQQKQIQKLVICGMMTHICIDSTVRAAKDFGFNVALIGDACATKDLEIQGELVKAAQVQKSFLAALNFYYAEVFNTKEYLSL